MANPITVFLFTVFLFIYLRTEDDSVLPVTKAVVIPQTTPSQWCFGGG